MNSFGFYACGLIFTYYGLRESARYVESLCLIRASLIGIFNMLLNLRIDFY